MSRLLLIGPLLLALLLSACPRSAPTADYKVPAQLDLREVLGAGDVFEVRVLEDDGLSGTYRVDADGTFSYPLLGVLTAGGKTATELSDLIRDGLAADYVRDPQVTVFVEEFSSRKVSVLGQVNKPGRYAFHEEMTLMQAIAEAGGTTESAVMSSVRVTRQGEKGEKISLDIPFKAITQGEHRDFPLMPGDIVFVAESAVR